MASAPFCLIILSYHIFMQVTTMSEKEKAAFAAVMSGASELATKTDESTVLAITASYLAGKAAGRREANAENRPE